MAWFSQRSLSHMPGSGSSIETSNIAALGLGMASTPLTWCSINTDLVEFMRRKIMRDERYRPRLCQVSDRELDPNAISRASNEATCLVFGRARSKGLWKLQYGL
jgi:hypothetical protein